MAKQKHTIARWAITMLIKCFLLLYFLATWIFFAERALTEESGLTPTGQDIQQYSGGEFFEAGRSIKAEYAFTFVAGQGK